MGSIHTETVNKVLVVSISNRSRHNALTDSMLGALDRILLQADEDPAIRVVVITGDGEEAFCTGHDLKETETESDIPQDSEHEGALIRPRNMRKPVIGAVNGHCYAAGLILALSCDVRVASTNARFCSPGARLGMMPVGGQIVYLTRLLPVSKGLEMMLTGRPLDAQEACTLGLVSEVVEKGEATACGLKLAESMAENSPRVLEAVKRGVSIALQVGEAAAHAYEHVEAERLKKGVDAKEGIAAFHEKRDPVFPDTENGNLE